MTRTLYFYGLSPKNKEIWSNHDINIRQPWQKRHFDWTPDQYLQKCQVIKNEENLKTVQSREA